MKRLFALFLSVTFLSVFIPGCCCGVEKSKDVVVKINNYAMTKDEFEEAFLDSPYAVSDTPDARREFLNNLINKKVILQYAEKKGIDKEKGFLKVVEKFWEQSLLKLALDRKAREITGNISVGDKDVKEAYEKMVKAGTAVKPYEEMYGQIKWDLTRLKQSQAMEEWVTGLRTKADIKVNEKLLDKI